MLHEGPASYFRGVVTINGTLYLTARRLRFRSLEAEGGVFDESISLESVERVRAVRTAIVVPNGVVVKTYDGREERFLVWGRALWMERIEQACASKEHR